MTSDEPMRMDMDQLRLWADEHELETSRSEGVSKSDGSAEQESWASERECLWDIKAVAQFLGVPAATIYRWRVEGKGPRATKMGKRLCFEPAVVRTWVSEHRESA